MLKFVPAFILVAVIASPADAMVFHYKQSELSTPAGAEGLYTRLSDRAVQNCTSINERGIWRRAANLACAEDLVTAVVVKIDDDGLTAIHEQRGEEILLSSRP